MKDFLKNIQKSLETGQVNDEVTKHHYDVLHGADMVNNVKKAKKDDDKIYEEELNDHIGLARMSRLDREYRATTEDDQSYIDGVFEFGGAETRETLMRKMQIANDNAKVQEEARNKRESIEMNKAHIILLEDEIRAYEIKIAKNKDLIEFLKTEIERTK